MVLQSTKVNNNTASDIIIERIRPFCLSLMIRQDSNGIFNVSHLVVKCIDHGVESVAVALGMRLDEAICPAGQDPLNLVVEVAVAPQTPFRYCTKCPLL